MDVGFDEILTNQDLFGQQFIDGDIGWFLPKVLQSGNRSFRIFPFRFHKNIDIQSGTRVAMNRKSCRAYYDEPDLMIF